MPTYEDATQFRFCVEVGGRVLRICKLALSNADGSVYLFPYGASGAYHFGRMSIPANEPGVTVPYKEQESSAMTPKLSIHESGQIHVKAGPLIVGPMFSSPMASLRGEHFATVSVARFAGLGPLGHAPRTAGTEIDVVLPAGDEAESGRLVFYANGAEPLFAGSCAITSRLVRSTLADPLFLGLGFFGQEPLSQQDESGQVIAISGWDPLHPPASTDPADHLFVVAK